MQSIIERGLKGLVLAGIFALPFIVLVVTHDMFFPFITGKNFLFRIFVEVMTFSWLALALINPMYRPKKSWLLGAFAAFVVVMAAADIFGINPIKSIWSNFERMEGLVTLVHLFFLFVVSTSVLTTEKLWRRFWETSIVVSVLVGLYGLLQMFGLIAINQGGARLDATFGNATYLAAYMIFHLFMTAILWAGRWYEGHNRALWSAIAVPVLALQFFILFFTETRGAILGLLGGIVLASFILVLLARDSKVVWRVSAGILAAVVIFTGAFFMLKNTPVVQGVGPLQRLASISLTDNTTKARFMNWGMAWEGFLERPLLGWGQENYNIVFNQHYNPGMYAQEQWFDRTHNVFFDWLIAGGFLGLFAYLSLFAVALGMLWRSRRVAQDGTRTNVFTVPERALLSGLLAAYFINNLFVFDNITSYLFFVFVLAYISARVAREKNVAALLSGFTLPRALVPYIAGGALVLVPVVAFALNYAGYEQNLALLNAVSPHQTIEENIDLFNKAISYGSFGTQEAREQLVQGALSLAGNAQITADAQQKLFSSAEQGMLDQIAAAPLDARFPLFLGTLYGSYGLPDRAEPYLRSAVELSLRKQTIRFQLGLVLMNEGKDAEALQLLKETYELETANTDAKIFYAMAAIRTGDAVADSLVAELGQVGKATDQRIVAAYASRQQYGKIVAIWQTYLEQHPRDLQASFGLAAAYYAAGSNAQAIAVLRDAQAGTDSDTVKAQIEQLISQIQDGSLKLQ